MKNPIMAWDCGTCTSASLSPCNSNTCNDIMDILLVQSFIILSTIGLSTVHQSSSVLFKLLNTKNPSWLPSSLSIYCTKLTFSPTWILFDFSDSPPYSDPLRVSSIGVLKMPRSTTSEDGSMYIRSRITPFEWRLPIFIQFCLCIQPKMTLFANPLFSFIKVPNGLEDLLEGLAREILRRQPENIHLFAAHYCEFLIHIRKQDMTAFNVQQELTPNYITCFFVNLSY
uniref:RIIa domain-containing protein n=1 Tax=Strigamia maritima TaxID=126957 RepID=T1JLY4_STRMM